MYGILEGLVVGGTGTMNLMSVPYRRGGIYIILGTQYSRLIILWWRMILTVVQQAVPMGRVDNTKLLLPLLSLLLETQCEGKIILSVDTICQPYRPVFSYTHPVVRGIDTVVNTLTFLRATINSNVDMSDPVLFIRLTNSLISLGKTSNVS